ncbi:MAG: hypothetical protein O2929_01300 [Cyanobacteria bacterium]|nr:hypothetical protein [Cyanobacteriota bacterium]
MSLLLPIKSLHYHEQIKRPAIDLTVLICIYPQISAVEPADKNADTKHK